MVNLGQNYFLMIEPDKQGEKSIEPIEDEITSQVRRIFALAQYKIMTKGFHVTSCNARSDNKIWKLPNGMETNSLCVYYVQYYRPYIPQVELDKISILSEKYL